MQLPFDSKRFRAYEIEFGAGGRLSSDSYLGHFRAEVAFDEVSGDYS